MKKDEFQESIIQGVSVGIALIVVGVVLLFIPNYLGNETVTSVFAYGSILVGLFGVGAEIDKLNGDSPKISLGNFALGIALIFLWIWIYSSFDNLIINIISLIFLVLGVYGATLAIIQFGSGIIQSENKKSIATKVSLTLINVITGLAVLYEALQKFGLIDSLAK